MMKHQNLSLVQPLNLVTQILQLPFVFFFFFLLIIFFRLQKDESKTNNLRRIFQQGLRKLHKKYPRRRQVGNYQSHVLILISNPYLPTKNKLLYLFILCKRNFIKFFFFFFWGTKGQFYLFKQTVYEKYIVCYKALSKSALLTNIPEILFIHKTPARLIYKNSINLQSSPFSQSISHSISLLVYVSRKNDPLASDKGPAFIN